MKFDILNKRSASDWVYIALLISIVSVVLIPCLSLGLVYWDDPQNLFENASLSAFKGHWSWAGVKDIFLADVSGNYNPLPVLSFAIEKCFFAPDPLAAPLVYHLDNVLLHVACCVCVFRLFRKLGLNANLAFAGALLFGIHPMRAESVAWVTERKDVLYGLFYLLAINSYINYIRAADKKTRWYIIAVLWSVLSYFSKIQAVSLPLSFMAIDYFIGRKWYSPKLLLEKLPWWSLSLLFGLVNLYFLSKHSVIGTGKPAVQYGALAHLAVGSYSYFMYLLKFIYPYQMVNTYPYFILSGAIYVTLILSVSGTGALLIWASRKGYRFIVFGWWFFFANVVFLLQIIPVGTAFMADRFTYIAYVGLIFIAVKGIGSLLQRRPGAGGVVTVVAGAYVLLLVFITNKQIKVWKNSFTLWTHAVQECPETHYNYYQLGSFCINAAIGKYDTVGMNQSSAELVHEAVNDLSIAEVKDSLEGRTDKETTYNIFQYLGIAFGELQENGRAIYYFSQGIAADPQNIQGYMNRANTYCHQKDYGAALRDYRSCIGLDPKNSDAYYRAALCEACLGKFNDGLADMNVAIGIDGAQGNYYYTRAKIYKALGQLYLSRQDALTAQQAGVRVEDALLH